MGTSIPLRTGLVGCGRHGNALGQAIIRTESLRLVACADPDEAAVNSAAALAPEISTHTSIEAMLAECEVDAVVIATPHHLLCPVTLTALRARKHVLAEKPIALNEREAAEIELAAGSDVTYMAGYSFRFSMARYVHEILATGAVGEIRGMTGTICTGPLNSGWIAHPETGGGPLLFVGSHLVDMILWFLEDEPLSVYADVQYRSDTGADESSAFQIRFGRGALAQCFVSQAGSTFFYELAVHGRAGKIVLRGHNFLQFEIEVSSNTLPTYAEPTLIRPNIRRDNVTMMLVPELEAFARAVQGQQSPPITVADGQRVLRILDAVFESGRLKRPVELAQLKTQ